MTAETSYDPEVASVDTALRQIRDTMASDGYELTWSESGGQRIVVRIAAGPDACADCLAPRPVLEAILSDALSSTPRELEQVMLPDEQH